MGRKRGRWSRKGKPKSPQRCKVCGKMVPADEYGYFQPNHPRCSRALAKAKGKKRKPLLPPSTSVRPVGQAGLPSLGKKR